jgi:alkanesulfonate monooxygenase SsuD/methylene tetrahydromethanopterin reductase-like flavin-dependent oxidoreductase (luciferase family)
MPRLIMRFDLRNIRQTTNPQLYADTLDLCQWADERGFHAVQLAEHHDCDDGYIPSPLVFGGAMAARTRRALLRFVLVLPHYNPLRLAEDLAVLDLLSQGRVIPIMAAGYAPHEFAMFGTDLADRGRLMEQGIAAIRSAWTGQPFAYQGRTVRVMPRPAQGDAMPLWMGGSSAVAARRAARLADHFYSNDTALWDVYRGASQELGHDPGPAPELGPGFLIVSENPDREWERMGPYIAAEMAAYARFGASRRRLMGDSVAESEAEDATSAASMTVDLDALRAMNAYPILTPDEALAYIEQLGPDDNLTLHPLISGVPMDIVREQLATFEQHILPHIAPGQ